MKVNLSAPWVIYYREIKALFGDDPEINVEYDEGYNKIMLYVDNPMKADAISKLLPESREFGNVTVHTVVIPANCDDKTKAGLYLTAFENNPVFGFIRPAGGVMADDINYIVFKNRVVQYFADNLHDIHGNISTLYENIARDVFGEDEGCFFCTDVADTINVDER